MPTISDLFAWFRADRVRDLVFLAGFGLFGGGIAAYSLPLAGAVCGALLMGLACWPYVWRR